MIIVRKTTCGNKLRPISPRFLGADNIKISGMRFFLRRKILSARFTAKYAKDCYSCTKRGDLESKISNLGHNSSDDVIFICANFKSARKLKWFSTNVGWNFNLELWTNFGDFLRSFPERWWTLIFLHAEGRSVPQFTILVFGF